MALLGMAAVVAAEAMNGGDLFNGDALNNAAMARMYNQAHIPYIHTSQRLRNDGRF